MSNRSSSWLAWRYPGAEVEDLDDAFSPWLYWYHTGKVYCGDFPHFGEDCPDDDAVAELAPTDQSCPAPDPGRAQEELLEEHGFSADNPPGDPPAMTGDGPAGVVRPGTMSVPGFYLSTDTTESCDYAGGTAFVPSGRTWDRRYVPPTTGHRPVLRDLPVLGQPFSRPAPPTVGEPYPTTAPTPALEEALVLAATGPDDERAPFPNWGAEVDLAAPGVDVLSLRAWRTDLSLHIPGVDYAAGDSFIGSDRRYYRSAGTSFSAPLVAGTAALLLGARPELTVDEVERMLVQSARDLDLPGRDRHTGYGLLDAPAALAADPAFFLDAGIDGVGVVVEEGAQLVEVTGTAAADRFAGARLELGAGESPEEWRPVAAPIGDPVRDGFLGRIPATELAGSPVWTLRVVARHENGRTREGCFVLNLQ